MHIPHHLLLCAGVVFLASCGGGGGGDDKDPLTQPETFLPEGVTGASLWFAPRGVLPEEVLLKQKTENLKSGDATWTAEVSGQVDGIYLPNGTTVLTPHLIGEVEVTRLEGNQGFLLTWRGQDSYAEGEAALEGKMQLQYHSVGDGNRQASVTIPSSELRLGYSNDDKPLQTDLSVLDGAGVLVTFTKPAETPPATENNAPSTK